MSAKMRNKGLASVYHSQWNNSFVDMARLTDMQRKPIIALLVHRLNDDRDGAFDRLFAGC